MPRTVEATVDGRQIYIEVEERAAVPLATAGTGRSEGFKSAREVNKLDEMSGTIASVCKSVFEKTFNTLGDAKPTEFEIEFGVTLAGEAGVPLVTKGSVEAALKVTARWGK